MAGGFDPDAFISGGTQTFDPDAFIGQPAPTSGVMDFLKSMPSGIVSNLANLAATSGAAAQTEMGQPVTVPNAAESNELLQRHVTGPLPQPQGTAGKIGQAVAGAVTNPLFYLGPEGIALKGAMAALSGAGGEVGNELAGPYGQLAGSILGAAGPSMLGRIVSPIAGSPETLAAANALRAQAIKPTAGQSTGSTALKYAESTLGNAPFAGNKATASNATQAAQLTAAAAKRAGIDATHLTPDIMDAAHDANGQIFDQVAARNPVIPIKPGFKSDLQNIADDFEKINGQRSPLLDSLVSRLDNPAISPAPANAASNVPTISGEAYQSIRSDILKFTRAAQKSNTALIDPLNDFRATLDKAVGDGLQTIGSPDAAVWQGARSQYKNLMVLDKALGSSTEAANRGLITPTALANADKAVGGARNYVRGKTAFSDLAHAANAALKPLPDSGTAARWLVEGLAGGGGLELAHSMLSGEVSPERLGALAAAAATPAIAGRLLMSRPGQAYLGNQLATGLRGGPMLSYGRYALPTLAGPNSPLLLGRSPQ